MAVRLGLDGDRFFASIIDSVKTTTKWVVNLLCEGEFFMKLRTEMGLKKLSLRVPVTWVLTVCLLVIGCGKGKSPWEKVYPAAGTLLFDGKPLAVAQVTLIPLDEGVPKSVRPTATTNDDGSFTLGTYSRTDGAPAGSYKVLALHYPIGGSKENPSAGANDLPAKYAKEQTTDLTLDVSSAGIEPSELRLKK